MKIVLSTLPTEGQFVNWTTSKDFIKEPDVVKYMPLGLLSLASNIEQEVVILDPPSMGWDIEETIGKIGEQEPDVLGLSAVTRRAYALKRILGEVDVPYIAVGGPHATHYADTVLRQGANSVFIGQLADKEFSLIGSKPEGKVYCSSDINDINFPDRTLVNFEDYFFDGKVLFEAEKRMPMFSSVGCPNHCRFCNVQSKKVQFKDPKIVADEMEALHGLGSGSVHVLDDNFNVRSSHLEGILSELERRNMQTEWSGRGQVRMDFGLVDRMKATGFRRIHAGLEALDDEILRYFNKPQKVEHIERFCAEMNRRDIDVLAYFITGSPVETPEYLRELPNRIRDLGITIPWFNILFPEPNTAYYEGLLGKEYSKDHWAEFMENPTPDYEIPYPYANKEKALETNARLTEEFKCKS